MRFVPRALLGLQLLAQPAAFAAEEKFLIELNSIEAVENRCGLNFVIENKSDMAIESMKLDLVVFGPDGGIVRRLLIEMGPVRPLKTIVRTFAVDNDCAQIGSILVNQVTACTPGNPNTCLDDLAVSSRLKELRFYK